MRVLDPHHILALCIVVQWLTWLGLPRSIVDGWNVSCWCCTANVAGLQSPFLIVSQAGVLSDCVLLHSWLLLAGLAMVCCALSWRAVPRVARYVQGACSGVGWVVMVEAMAAVVVSQLSLSWFASVG